MLMIFAGLSSPSKQSRIGIFFRGSPKGFFNPAILSALFCADTVFLKLSYSTLSKTETDNFPFVLKSCHLSRIWCF